MNEEFAIKDASNAMLNLLIEVVANQRIHIQMMQAALTELQGKYYSLAEMDLERQQEMARIRKFLYENYGDIDTDNIGLSQP